MTATATCTTTTSITTPDEFDFSFAHSHYNIYPWIATNDALLRVVRHNEQPVLVRIAPSRDVLALELHAAHSLAPTEIALVAKDITWGLGLTDKSQTTLALLAREDPVIAAALRVNRGIRPKRYLDLFEAICGAICAQNVDFRRLYQMMQALAVTFGPAISLAGTAYHAFPRAHEVATKTDAELRACKVGYRSKVILKAAAYLAAQGDALDRERLAACDPQQAMDRLCDIPGIGPYSAGIVLGAGIGRTDIFHLDSFTRHILHTFYYKGRKVNDDRLRKFAAKRWPHCAGAVAHLLTTNTHVWAADFGHIDFRPSGARPDTGAK